MQPKYRLSLPDARRLIAEHGWARVVTDNADAGLRATYGYFLLEDCGDDEVVVVGHFARADPQADDIQARRDTLLVFEGPHGFISASWYAPDLTRLPGTWNHMSVHLLGSPEPLAGAEGFEVLRRTVARHEESEAAPWRLEGEALEFALHNLFGHTIPFRLRARRIEAKAKLSQAMPRPVRERVVENLQRTGSPHENRALAAEMRRLSLTPEADAIAEANS